MEAIEALARVDVLCLDKTGTITTGELKVEEVIPVEPYRLKEIEYIMGVMAHEFDDVNATQLALQDYFFKQDNVIVNKRIPFHLKERCVP